MMTPWWPAGVPQDAREEYYIHEATLKIELDDMQTYLLTCMEVAERNRGAADEASRMTQRMPKHVPHAHLQSRPPDGCESRGTAHTKALTGPRLSLQERLRAMNERMEAALANEARALEIRAEAEVRLREAVETRDAQLAVASQV